MSKWYKMCYKPKKSGIFEVKVKNSLENTIIKISLPMWHILYLYDNLELKISQISYKNGQKKKKKICYQGGIRTQDRTGSSVNHGSFA